MTTKQLQNRAIECRNIAEQILQERGMSKTYRARLETDKVGLPRIVIEYYYVHPRFPQNYPWHLECDFIFHADNKLEYWSCGSSSWHYDFSMVKFEELMYNVGIYHVV